MNINRATLVPFPHEYVCKLTKICAFIAAHKGRTMMILLLKQSRDCLGKNSFMIDHVFESGEGRILNKCLYGEPPPGGPTPNPFYTNHFSQKRYSFRIPSIDKWYPFHIPCLELCIHFNCCKCTVFSVGINHKNKTFSRLYQALTFIC